MADQRFLVTAALPYSNGRLHVGHIAGAYLPADTYVRYLRACGRDVRFICGSDDNGVATLITAMKENSTPQQITAYYNARQQADFAGLGIKFDIYGGTHQPQFVELHERISQAMFKTIHAKGFFSKRPTKQLYDPLAGKFLPDRYVEGTCPYCHYQQAYGDQCEHCGKSMDPLLLIEPLSTITGTRPEVRQTVHWYLRLDRFEKPLARWLDGHGNWRPGVLNFCRGLLKEGLPERAMTRDLDWGVPVPLDDPDARGKVLYVWFDAPIGYISFTAAYCQRQEGDWQAYERWWKQPDCKIIHFIGEDNIIFHALIWPAMLMAEGSYQLPDNVVANAFLNIKFPGQDEEKISKSRGTAIWIEEYLKRFEPDPLRYYLTAIAPEAQRSTFDIDEFISRNNNELLNTFGNFVNRVLTFACRYLQARVPQAGNRDEVDRQQLAACRRAADKTAAFLERFHFKAALAEVMALARQSNAYFDAKQPWAQRKTDPAGCATTINVCIQTIKTLATIAAPFVPFSAEKCLAQLGLEAKALPWDQATVELPAGHSLGQPQVLFRKLDPTELFEA
ncbi:MAG: methionine--tRNA ligase [Phycisphaerae bacterium]